MRYWDALEATVSRNVARHEIEVRHSASWSDFVEEFGDEEEYEGSDILAWLGY
ncbi:MULTISPECIES: hypothetical protein [Herbaspirillum]|uniref:hypothetical protein n=1 Tax=Herbaspirillum TaxID=963 RepID=UPI002176CB58|nr:MULTISPECIES: hypothetical protein [Herbaspirillum]UWE19325.1 hypothetical protein NY669_26985 [Herbaspirillum huttiense]|tara:strand:+ start:1798 stop:1956 length:159 start_codon:yes stop_codon:yes gene_type:complete